MQDNTMQVKRNKMNSASSALKLVVGIRTYRSTHLCSKEFTTGLISTDRLVNQTAVQPLVTVLLDLIFKSHHTFKEY